MKKVKITVIKKFHPKDVFGHEVIRHDTGKAIPPCYLEENQEFIVENYLEVPKGFCTQAWHDIYNTIMVYLCDGDYEYPYPRVTYTPCGDGVRPVIFKIEKINE